MEEKRERQARLAGPEWEANAPQKGPAGDEAGGWGWRRKRRRHPRCQRCEGGPGGGKEGPWNQVQFWTGKLLWQEGRREHQKHLWKEEKTCDDWLSQHHRHRECHPTCKPCSCGEAPACQAPSHHLLLVLPKKEARSDRHPGLGSWRMLSASSKGLGMVARPKYALTRASRCWWMMHQTSAKKPLKKGWMSTQSRPERQNTSGGRGWGKQKLPHPGRCCQGIFGKWRQLSESSCYLCKRAGQWKQQPLERGAIQQEKTIERGAAQKQRALERGTIQKHRPLPIRASFTLHVFRDVFGHLAAVPVVETCLQTRSKPLDYESFVLFFMAAARWKETRGKPNWHSKTRGAALRAGQDGCGCQAPFYFAWLRSWTGNLKIP